MCDCRNQLRPMPRILVLGPQIGDRSADAVEHVVSEHLEHLEHLQLTVFSEKFAPGPRIRSREREGLVGGHGCIWDTDPCPPE